MVPGTLWRAPYALGLSPLALMRAPRRTWYRPPALVRRLESAYVVFSGGSTSPGTRYDPASAREQKAREKAKARARQVVPGTSRRLLQT